MRKLIFVLLLLPVLSNSAGIAEKTAGMDKAPGYFTYYWDSKAGKIWLEVDKWDTEFLYVTSLPAGIGSNDIGLDRGQLSGSHVVKFIRGGPKVLLVQVNYAFRAISSNPDERKAVEDAFAQSVLGGFDVAAEDGNHALVDASAFFLRDAHDVIGTLKRTNQGIFRLDPVRSAFYLARTKNFPQNTEVEATLTFASDDPGPWVRQVTPTPGAVTVREHHSFVQLPDDKYQPRAFDPRAGFFGTSYMDYATPITEPIVKRFIDRHRLQKRNPGPAPSEAVKPIVYYLDRGAPEPIRSALLEGARWWNQAFEAAGYINAFRVEMMPEGVDPMDVRYNVIQWIHRSTRGWSYGSAVSDPRTGEIIKGHVSLGSLRVRQDYLIAEGLLIPYEQSQPANPGMQRMALARLRQLAAHEVGHTLGLSHNYIASTANRASVMDYPPPTLKISPSGDIDLSDAYAVGIGEWDKVAITYGYKDLATRADLDSIIAQARGRGLIFLTDQDARPSFSSHPATHLWDSGTNAVDELAHIMKVRELALSRFSEKNIREGAPMATLEEVLVPVYLLHRYQVEAASKVLGGLTYTYALRGDGQKPTEMVPPQEQRRALDSLLKTITPATLALPERLIDLIPPHPLGFQRNREVFRLRTGMTFDPLAAAETAAHHTIGLLLDPQRAGRLVEHHARSSAYPGLDEVIDRLVAASWKATRQTGYNGEVQRTVDDVALHHLISLATAEGASSQVRAVAGWKIDQLKTWATRQRSLTTDPGQQAHLHQALALIHRFQVDPKPLNLPHLLEPPDGAPIGMDCDWERL